MKRTWSRNESTVHFRFFFLLCIRTNLSFHQCARHQQQLIIVCQTRNDDNFILFFSHELPSIRHRIEEEKRKENSMHTVHSTAISACPLSVYAGEYVCTFWLKTMSVARSLCECSKRTDIFLFSFSSHSDGQRRRKYLSSCCTRTQRTPSPTI